MNRRWIETIETDIRTLREDIERLSRDVRLKPNEPFEQRVFDDLRALLAHGHEIRAFIGTLDEAERSFIARITPKRSSFATRDQHYAVALENARLIHKDDLAVIREFGTCLTATQLVLHERTPLSVWEGVRHLLKELKHLESRLVLLRTHLAHNELPW